MTPRPASSAASTPKTHITPSGTPYTAQSTSATKKRRRDPKNDDISPSRTIKYYSSDRALSEFSVHKSYLSASLLTSGDFVAVEIQHNSKIGIDDMDANYFTGKLIVSPLLLENMDIAKSNGVSVDKSFTEKNISLSESVRIRRDHSLHSLVSVYEDNDSGCRCIVVVSAGKVPGSANIHTLVIDDKDEGLTHTHTTHEIQLHNNSEYITTISHLHGAETLIMGSSLGRLYLLNIDTKSNKVEASVLLPHYIRQASLLTSLITTGAKLLGFQSLLHDNLEYTESTLKVIWVPASSITVSVFPTRILLWDKATKIGQERIVDDIQLSALLADGFRKQGLSFLSIYLTDAIVLPPLEDLDGYDGSASGSRAKLHIMCLVITQTANAADEITSGLWLAAVRVTEDQGSFSSKLLTCLSIDQDILTGLGFQGCPPQLHYVSPSHRFFITWPGSAGLRVARMDGLNIALSEDVEIATALDKTMETRASNYLLTQVTAEETAIEAEEILSVTVVHGFEAACILKKDGVVYLSCPEVQGHPRQRVEHAESTSSTRPFAFLLAIATGKLLPSKVPDKLIRALKPLVDDLTIDRVCRYLISPSRYSPHTDSNPLASLVIAEVNRLARRSETINDQGLVRETLDRRIEVVSRILTALDSWGWDSASLPAKQLLQSLSMYRALHGSLQDLNTRASCLPSQLAQQLSIQLSDTDNHSRQPSSTQFLDGAYLGGLEVWLEAIVAAVSERGDLPADQGALLDAFFVQEPDVPTLLSCLAKTIEGTAPSSWHSLCRLYGACLPLASSLSSASIPPLPPSQFLSSDVDIVCDTQVRESLMRITKAMAEGVKLSPAGTWEGADSAQVFLTLTSSLLQSFSHEARTVGRLSDDEQVVRDCATGQYMSSPWKQSYHAAKAAVRDLLLPRYPQIAFALAQEHWDVEGLLLCYSLAPDEFHNSLMSIIEHGSNILGTGSVCLGERALVWFEEHGASPNKLFEIGALCPVHLNRFLESRPSFAWQYQLECGTSCRYERAAPYALAHGASIPHASQAKTVLSIAKIASRLALLDSSDAASQSAFLLEADRHLGLLRAQEAVQTFAPEHLDCGPDNRAHPLSIVAAIVSSLQTASEHSSSGRLSRKDVEIYKQFVVVGLSVLTMVDGYEPRETIDEAVLGLWATCLAAEAGLWLELSLHPESSLSKESENELLSSLFAEAVIQARKESAVFDRGELLPTCINAAFIPDTEASDLLKAVIEASGLTKLGIDRNTGDLLSDQNNEEVSRLISIAAYSRRLEIARV